MLCKAQYNNSSVLLIIVILNNIGHGSILDLSSKIEARGQPFQDTSVPVVVYFVVTEIYFYWVLIHNDNKVQSKFPSKQNVQGLEIW